jgi:hypothetical protein
MTQTLYAHVNKRKKNKINYSSPYIGNRMLRSFLEKQTTKRMKELIIF